MTEDEKLNLSLSEKLLKLMLNEKIPFEKKIGNMDYLIRIGADVNKKIYGKSMAYWASETGDDKIVEYIKEKGGVENQISKKERDELGRQFWGDDEKIRSVKEIKELVLMGADLSVKNNNDEQIWKYLSLEDMGEVLKDLPKGYVIDGVVDLNGKGLTQLPDFSKIKVKGTFFCHGNQLTTLQGAPKEVGGDFWCYNNQLADLRGAPNKVGGSFICNGNQLKDLKGAPNVVGGYFNCYNNQLTSLEGAPSEVGGGFYCHKNQLTDLKGAPSVVGGGFNCGDNQLTDLKGAPKEVGGVFWCYENQLTDLKGAPKEVRGNFDCRENQLTTLEGKPEKIGGVFVVEEEVLARIEEAEKKKKNNAVMGFIRNLIEM